VLPLVRHLEAERILLLGRQLLHLVETARVLCHDGALLEVRDDIMEVVFGGKVLDILHENISWNVGERIGDPAVVNLGQQAFGEGAKAAYIASIFLFRLIEVTVGRRPCSG
jgi:hypothetical protein